MMAFLHISAILCVIILSAKVDLHSALEEPALAEVRDKREAREEVNDVGVNVHNRVKRQYYYYYPSTITSAQSQAMVDYHNSLRSQQGAADMKQLVCSLL